MTDTAGLMHILQICDSLFPVGAFTLSNGLETYVQHDIITCLLYTSDAADD